jgi:hypothetical protein
MENIHNAILLANELTSFCTPVVPHLTGFWHVITPKPYEEWLEYDLGFVDASDAIFRMDNESSGADGEVAEAVKQDKPIFYGDIPALRAWCEAWTLARIKELETNHEKPRIETTAEEIESLNATHDEIFGLELDHVEPSQEQSQGVPPISTPEITKQGDRPLLSNPDEPVESSPSL